ncbi:alpha/beta fold hydrolase [Curtobacterium sp. RRHDQ10]|uniref:alpha/beta fold hydrolase n=1 Tax=Curtobacterium phyllosphaerae TaxID=3413379 RepID=UPI003BF43A3F
MVSTMKRTVVDDGVTIAYRVFDGVEPAVVVLHGLAGSSREFIDTANGLAGRRVILIDQRGHGHSTTRPADTSRQAYVSDVVAVIGKEASGPVILVGQSMGAHTAMLVTAARPDLVRQLVMLEGNQGGGTADEHRTLGDFFRSWVVPFTDRAEASAALGEGLLERAWIDDLEERADGLHPRFDANVMQATIEAVGEPRWAEWESVEVPTLVVYADGGMFSEEQKTEFVSRGRTVRRMDLTGASHDAHLDAFDQWMSALRSAVADSPAS